MEVVVSGILGLDEIISIKRGSLITLAGAPGVGKTTFASQFIYEGLMEGESGVYVSFAEDRESFLDNMHGYGLDFEGYEKDGKFRFLDLVTVKYAGVSTILEEVMRIIDSLEAGRLVIDSFTALAQAFVEKVEARLILHNTLSKIINRMGCTTLIIVETPIGTEQLGLGLEEFVSDILLVMRREVWNGRLIRKLEIIKCRGASIERPSYLFTIRNGVEILPPLKTLKGRFKPFKPILDSKGYFSTGNEQLDKILGGGIPKGSILLNEVDEDIPNQAILLPYGVLVKNWLSLGKGILILPSPRVPIRRLNKWLKENLEISDETLSRQSIVMLKKDKASRYIESKNVKVFDGLNPKEDVAIQIEVLNDLREKTGKPVLVYLPVDFIYSFYRDKFEEWLSTFASEIIENGDLLAIRVNSNSPTINYLASLASNRIKMISSQGNVLLCSEKPWSKFYHLASIIDGEGVSYKLTPMI